MSVNLKYTCKGGDLMLPDTAEIRADGTVIINGIEYPDLDYYFADTVDD